MNMTPEQVMNNFLIPTGKRSLELTHTALSDEVYCPKVAYYMDETVHVATYEFDLDLLPTLVEVIRSKGRVEWIGHTADTYMWLGTDEELAALGKRPTQLWEEGHLQVVEALDIRYVDPDRTFAAIIPYRRNRSRIQWMQIRYLTTRVDITDMLGQVFEEN
jgi:hypothetical protein